MKASNFGDAGRLQHLEAGDFLYAMVITFISIGFQVDIGLYITFGHNEIVYMHTPPPLSGHTHTKNQMGEESSYKFRNIASTLKILAYSIIFRSKTLLRVDCKYRLRLHQ